MAPLRPGAARTNRNSSCIWTTAPSMPVTSLMLVTRRLPSGNRCNWTMILIAEAIWDRMLPSLMAKPAIPTICSSRDNRIARAVGMDRRHRSLVAGGHRLQHVEGFLAANLADDDAVRPHAQRVLDELALPDLAAALDAGRSRLQAAHVRLLQLQLGGVLDGDQALPVRDVAGQRIEECGLAAAGAAGNDDREARLDRLAEDLGHRRAQRPRLDQGLHVEGLGCELADRDQRPIDRDRPDRHVDARSVGQPGVDHRLGFVHAAPDAADDLVDDAQDVRLVLEAHGRPLQLAEALDVDPLVRVDQDVGDRGVLQEGLDGPEARELVHDLVDELAELARVERDTLGQNVVGDELVHLLAQLRSRCSLDVGEIELVDQLAVQRHLGIDELRLLQRPVGAGRNLDGRWLCVAGVGCVQPAACVSPLTPLPDDLLKEKRITWSYSPAPARPRYLAATIPASDRSMRLDRRREPSGLPRLIAPRTSP